MTGTITADRPALAWPRDPYKGLNYFTAADVLLFGERDAEIDQVTELLCEFDTKVLLLHGMSGTGKSSLLRAGLLPHLRQFLPSFGRAFFFLPEVGRDGTPGDPLILRSSEDPIGRIHEALWAATACSDFRIPDDARAEMRKWLAGASAATDRWAAVKPILKTLKALTKPPQRDRFVLIVDQVEEVLTLPQPPEIENARKAFFNLIEHICVERMDMSVILSLRTEYYGRFCSFFHIRPATSVSPAHTLDAGLVDYLLPGLAEERQIVSAIVRPTLAEPIEGMDELPPPREVYHFTYAEGLPETIAKDLKAQLGEASLLPAMQIVCKQLYEHVIVDLGRSQIEEDDYIDVGRIQGVITRYVGEMIRSALSAAGQDVNEEAVDIWLVVLARVVGRGEGATIRTQVASEQDLVDVATGYDIPAPAARAVLREMADPNRRLLRQVEGLGGVASYSLGHDTLGLPILRNRAEAEGRSKERAEARQRIEDAERRAQFERAQAEARAQADRAQAAQRLAEQKAEAAQAAARAAADRSQVAQHLAEQRAEAARLKTSRLRWQVGLIGSLLLVSAVATGAIFFIYTTLAPVKANIDATIDYASTPGDYRLRLLLLAAAREQGEGPLRRLLIHNSRTEEAIRAALGPVVN